VVFAAGTVNRAMPVAPNCYRVIRGVVGVDSGGGASAGNFGGVAKASSGENLAGGQENPDAGDDWRRVWAGGSAVMREGKF
jgi:hypothetical protein